MPHEQLRPAEAPPRVEGNVMTRIITPRTARIIASTLDPEFLRPNKVLEPANVEAFTNHLKAATPDSLSYAGIETTSLRSRVEYWQRSEKSFAGQNEEWNTATWDWMKMQLDDDAPHKDHAKAALSSLGLSGENEHKTGELYDEVETFRKKYVGETSNIKSFVSDIASGCMENGEVNLLTLEQRLIAIQGLLPAFGETHDIPQLISEFSMTHALLSQSEVKKVALVPLLLPYLSVPFAQAMEYHMRRLQETETSRPDRTITSTTQSSRPDTAPPTNDQEASEGGSVRPRSEEEEEDDDDDDDNDRTTSGRAGDNDPTTIDNHSGDNDRSTIGNHSGDNDRTTDGASGDNDRSTNESEVSEGEEGGDTD